MKKYTEKSNWISYRENSDGVYNVHNHIIDENFEMTRDEIEFLERLDGRNDPYEILHREFGMTREEADDYVDTLTYEGILRRGNSMFGLRSMRTVIKIYDSKKYQRISIVLLGIIMLSFIPVLYGGIRSTCRILEQYNLVYLNRGSDAPFWLGPVIGIIGGVFFHELNHAIACCAFGGVVMEFGVAFKGLPAAYTLLDYKKISRLGQVLIDLAGVAANLMISALSMWIFYHVGSYMTLFTMIAATNLELALVNLLFIEGLDGYNAMTKLLGPSDIYEEYRTYLNGFKNKTRKRVLSESGKTLENVFRIFEVSNFICPLLILFYLCVIFGW